MHWEAVTVRNSTVLIATLLALAPLAGNAVPIVDYSGLTVESNTGGYANGGVQFLNATSFSLTGVKILLGLSDPGIADFQIIEFDGAMGDTTGTVIGTVVGVNFGGFPFDSFEDDSTFVDVSSLGLTLAADTVYGFALSGGFAVAGRTGSSDTDPTIGAIYNGDGDGTFQTAAGYEIPFIAYGGAISVPEPGTLSLLGLGFLGMGFARRRRKV